MSTDLELKRKWTFQAHGQRLVVFKKSGEKSSHVLMKAFLWAIYLERYPELAVEVAIDHRYKPDLVAIREGRPVFWAECGQVGEAKLRQLFRQFPKTHFCVAKWASAPNWDKHLTDCLNGLKRFGPVELWVFPEDSEERFVGLKGQLSGFVSIQPKVF